MTIDNVANHASWTFPEPIFVEYCGMQVWEVPPNGQGVAGLIALEGLGSLEWNGIVGGGPATSPHLCKDDGPLLDEGSMHHCHHPQPSCDMLHAQIEMMRLGFGDACAYVCNPDFAAREESTTEWLLNSERISQRAMRLFDKEKATIHSRPDSTSCTMSFQVVDGEGNAMSFVNRYVYFSCPFCYFQFVIRSPSQSVPLRPHALHCRKNKQAKTATTWALTLVLRPLIAASHSRIEGADSPLIKPIPMPSS
jgi:gamma-glutamyltranspeptidase